MLCLFRGWGGWFDFSVWSESDFAGWDVRKYLIFLLVIVALVLFVCAFSGFGVEHARCNCLCAYLLGGPFLCSEGRNAGRNNAAGLESACSCSLFGKSSARGPLPKPASTSKQRNGTAWLAPFHVKRTSSTNVPHSHIGEEAAIYFEGTRNLPQREAV